MNKSILPFAPLKNSRGSIVMIMVAIVIIGIISVSLSQMLVDSTKTQRHIQQRQAALILQMAVIELLSDRTTCEVNFRDQVANTAAQGWRTRAVLRNRDNTGDVLETLADNPDATYEQGLISINAIRFGNYRARSAVGMEQYRGAMDLAIEFQTTGASNGPSILTRNIQLVVELKGATGGAPANQIQTCVAVGNDSNQPWITNASGDIFYQGGNVAIFGNGTPPLPNPPTQRLQVDGNILARAFYHPSDERLKTDITPVGGLEIIEGLRGLQYRWKDDGKPATGVLAQDVEKLLPSAVATDPHTGLKSVDYEQLIGPLIEATKELARENRKLRQEIESLKRK